MIHSQRPGRPVPGAVRTTLARLKARPWAWRVWGAGLVLALVGASLPWSADTSPLTQAAGITGLHRSGNQILNGAGQVVRLRGVNIPSGEYACIQDWGIFEGPT